MKIENGRRTDNCLNYKHFLVKPKSNVINNNGLSVINNHDPNAQYLMYNMYKVHAYNNIQYELVKRKLICIGLKTGMFNVVYWLPIVKCTCD